MKLNSKPYFRSNSMKNACDSIEEFSKYLKTDYEPWEVEKGVGDSGQFVSGTLYPEIGLSRNFFLCMFLKRHMGPEARIADLGIFPGTQAKLIKELVSKDISITGVGLGLTDEFRTAVSPYVDPIHEIDLDPFYSGHDTEVQIPIDDDSLDAVYAMEIVEHLITPIPMLSEVKRTLKPGGYLIMSTPNVSHFGALMYLLRGKSNYEALEKSPMCIPDSDWRGHVRVYSKEELIWLGKRFGLSCFHHQFYFEKGHDLVKWKGLSKPYYLLRKWLGLLVPWWREDQIIVLQKV